jgi:hypothetical protein
VLDVGKTVESYRMAIEDEIRAKGQHQKTLL